MFRDPILLAYWDIISISYEAMKNTAQGVPTFEYFKNHMYNPNEPVYKLVPDCNPSPSNLARDNIDDDSIGAEDEIHLSGLDNLVNDVFNDASEKDIAATQVPADKDPVIVNAVVEKAEQISQRPNEAGGEGEPISERANEVPAKPEQISQCANEVVAKEVTVVQPEQVPAVPSIESIGTSYLLHSVEANDCMSVIPGHFGCDDYCLDAEKDAIVVSEFMITNKKILEPMRKLRKDVIDFCFLYDHTFSTE
jgi:hypothetical protein